MLEYLATGEHVSTLVKSVILGRLDGKDSGRATLQMMPRQRLRTQVESWSGDLRHLAEMYGLGAVPAHWLSRLIDLALDAVYSAPLGAELHLACAPVALPALPVHALIFTHYPQVGHEIYPLILDAFVHNIERFQQRVVQVIGVHEEWLQHGLPQRAMFIDEATGHFCEADLLNPLPLRSAQVLMLGGVGEAELHQRLASLLLATRLLNPADGAAKLDDKAWTGECWQRAGLPTPCGEVTTPMTDPAGLAARLGKHIILKPIAGTEGQGVVRLDATRVQSPVPTGMLVMEERGNLRMIVQGDLRPFVLRLNVCWDGEGGSVESGFAVVAASSTAVASVGHHGQVTTVSTLWKSLYQPDSIAYHPTADDWLCVRQLAIDGARALADTLGSQMPALIGIDLLLDITETGELLPLLLEANPRPGGMARSTACLAGGPSDDPLIATRYWDIVCSMNE